MQAVSPQNSMHLQAAPLGQLDAVVIDEQRCQSYPAVVAYQRYIFTVTTRFCPPFLRTEFPFLINVSQLGWFIG